MTVEAGEFDPANDTTVFLRDRVELAVTASSWLDG